MSKGANGRSSIHKDQSGKGWHGWVSMGAHPVTGKPVRKHVRGRSKSEVAEKVAKLEAQRDGGIVPVGRDTTLIDWLEAWVAARARSVRPNTVSGYRTDLLHVTRSGVGAVKLRSLAPEHIERVYARVLASGCTAGSVAHVKRTARAALNVAVQRGYLPRNPVPLAQEPRAEEFELEPYAAAEIARILIAARARRNGVRWSLALLGLRQGEVLGLQWKYVDLDAGTLRVRRTLTWLPWQHGCADAGEPICGRKAGYCPKRHGGGAYLGEPKSAAGKRTIALPAPMVAELREHRRRQAAGRMAAGSLWHEQGFVVAGHRGGPVDRSTDTEDWCELVEAAGVRRLRIHDLRHSAATALLVLGEDSRVLLGVMGWTSMALVQRYTHLVPELRRSVADRQAQMWPKALRGRADHAG
jgi:integrase